MRCGSGASRSGRMRATLWLRFPARFLGCVVPVCPGDRPVIGIDLHRRRSVLVRLPADDQQIGRCVRIANDVPHLLAQLVGAGEHPREVLEATYGWYWAVLGGR